MDARLAAEGLPAVAGHGKPGLGQAEHPDDRLSGCLLLCRAEEEGDHRLAGRARSGNSGYVQEARHPDRGAEGARQCRGRPESGRRCGVRQRQRGHHLSRGTEPRRRDLPVDQRGDPRASRAGEEMAGQGGAAARQLFRHAQLRGLFRRHLRVHPQGREMPDGAEHLFPHQCRKYRPVRTHADHRRGRQLCQLSGRLHRADAR